MSEQNCAPPDVNGCIRCDPVPYQPAVPDRWVIDTLTGWDAGARSKSTLWGNLRLRFQVGPAVGIVIGITSPAIYDAARPDSIQHGFYLWSQGTGLLGRVLEFGQQKGEAFEREAETTLAVQRFNGRIYYLVDGAVIYVSPDRSSAEVCVGACLYQTDDTVY